MSPLSPFLAPERDSAFKAGRAKMAGTTFNCMPGVWSTTVSSGNYTAGQDVYAPFEVRTPLVIDQLLAEVTTLFSGGNFRIGFYPAGTDWQPAAGAAPLADSGSILTTTTGVKTYTPGTPIFVPRGRYVSVFNVDNGTAAFRILKGGPLGLPLSSTLGGSIFLQTMVVERAYAAFPTPGTPWDIGNTSSLAPIEYQHFYRVSQP